MKMSQIMLENRERTTYFVSNVKAIGQNLFELRQIILKNILSQERLVVLRFYR